VVPGTIITRGRDAAARHVRVPDLAAVPDAVGRHALRIVQEALTNARKHAASEPVDLRVEGAKGKGW
jgi:signal transduction histidine kinase